MSLPAVSVVMAVHNAQDVLDQAVDSVLGQSLRELELILVLDGPTDGTEAVARARAAADSRVRILAYQPNQGLPHALNQGVREARAPYVARQDADDISEPDRLARQLEAARTQSLDLVGSNFTWLDVQGRFLGVNTAFPRSVDEVMRRGSFLFPHGSALFSKDAFLRVGGYDERFFFTQDLELWSRFARSGARVGLLSRPLYRLRLGPGSSLKPRYQALYSALVARAYFDGEDIGPQAASLRAALTRERAASRESRDECWWRYCFRAANLAARSGLAAKTFDHVRQGWSVPGPWTARLWRTVLAGGLLLVALRPDGSPPHDSRSGEVILLGGPPTTVDAS